MTFAGLSDPKDRAAVIRYLAANTENPPPSRSRRRRRLPPASEPAAPGTEAEQTGDQRPMSGSRRRCKARQARRGGPGPAPQAT